MGREAKRKRRVKPPEVPRPTPAAIDIRLRAALILIAALAVYWNGLSAPFIFDDAGTITGNPQIRAPFSWQRALSPPAESAVTGRLLVNLSFAINVAAGGLDSTGYHAVNLALHVLCGWLVYGLVRRTLEIVGAPVQFGWRPENIALAAALLWTVHPVNSEVVLYVTQRTESLMAVFYLFTLYASVRSLSSPRRTAWQAAAVLSCLAGIGCKETIATAPLIVVLYDAIFVFGSMRKAIHDRWGFYVCLASTWVLVAALVLSHGQTLAAGFSSANTSVWTYFLNQPVMLTRYLWLTVWPQSLVVYYGWPRPLTLTDVWPSGVFIVGLFALTIVALVRKPRIGFLGAWFFITLAPSSSFVPIATEVGAERRMYLPLVALMAYGVIGALVAWHHFLRRQRRPAVSRSWLPAAAVASIVVLFGVRAAARCREYESALTLAQTVLARWPTPNANYLVGTELAAVERHEEAIPYLRAAVQGYPPVRYVLGKELLAVGRIDEGVAVLESFVQVEPGLVATRSARIRMARAFEARQEWARAIEQYRKILTKDPSDAEGHGLLADALAGAQMFDEAIPHYRAYLDRRPGDGKAWTGLGIALAATSQSAGAVDAFRHALNAEPANTRFRLNLARGLLDRGDLSEAATLAQQAASADAKDPAAEDILAQVFARRGEIDLARRHFERALQIDPSYAPAQEGLRSLRGRQ